MEIIIEKRNDRIKYSDFLGENPISLDKGVYICKHPSPGEAID